MNAEKYKVISIDGKYKYEHRYIMEQSIGRKLDSKEYIHHIDGNPSNNALANLQIVTPVTHREIHAKVKGSCSMCDKIEYVKGLCMSHYHNPRSETYRRKMGVPKRKPRGVCVIKECGNYVNARGLCNKHYHQASRKGMEGRKSCIKYDCKDVVRGFDLCNKHYKKKRYYEKKGLDNASMG